MMSSTAWALVRDDPTHRVTDADRYAQREYGRPDVAWLLSQDGGELPPLDRVNLSRSQSRFRRIAQTIVAFF